MPKIADTNVVRFMSRYPGALRAINLVVDGSEHKLRLGRNATPIGSGVLGPEHIPNFRIENDGYQNTMLAFLHCLGSLQDGPKLLMGTISSGESIVDIETLITKFAKTSMRTIDTPWAECQPIQNRIFHMDQGVALSIGWFLRNEALGPRKYDENYSVGTMMKWLSEGTVAFPPQVAGKALLLNAGLRIWGLELKEQPFRLYQYGGIIDQVKDIIQTILTITNSTILTITYSTEIDEYQVSVYDPCFPELVRKPFSSRKIQSVLLTNAADPEIIPDAKLAEIGQIRGAS